MGPTGNPRLGCWEPIGARIRLVGCHRACHGHQLFWSFLCSARWAFKYIRYLYIIIDHLTYRFNLFLIIIDDLRCHMLYYHWVRMRKHLILVDCEKAFYNISACLQLSALKRFLALGVKVGPLHFFAIHPDLFLQGFGSMCVFFETYLFIQSFTYSVIISCVSSKFPKLSVYAG